MSLRHREEHRLRVALAGTPAARWLLSPWIDVSNCFGSVLRENRVPFDSKSGYSWFLSEDIAADLLDDGLARWFRGQLLVLVLVVHIVSYAYELASIVAAREKNDGDA